MSAEVSPISVVTALRQSRKGVKSEEIKKYFLIRFYLKAN